MSKEIQPTFSEKIYNDEEMALIQDLFKDDRVLKLMRKIFLPEYSWDAPIGQQVDLMLLAPLEQMGISERMVKIETTRGVMKHIEARLRDLKVLANPPKEADQSKNSAK